MNNPLKTKAPFTKFFITFGITYIIAMPLSILSWLFVGSTVVLTYQLLTYKTRLI